MELRVLDDLFCPPGRGVLLFSMDEDRAPALYGGATLVDALGNRHMLASVTEQEGLYTLHLPQAEPAYFERLFRNVRVDATLFTFAEEKPCP